MLVEESWVAEGRSSLDTSLFLERPRWFHRVRHAMINVDTKSSLFLEEESDASRLVRQF